MFCINRHPTSLARPARAAELFVGNIKKDFPMGLLNFFRKSFGAVSDAVMIDYTQPVPHQGPEISPPLKTCPRCGSDFEIGRVISGSPGWSFFFVGFSVAEIYFVDSNGKRVKLPDESRAQRCKNCGTVMFRS
jgi:hypothetical protein